MKTKSILVLCLVLTFLPALTLTAQKADFNGEWNLNKEKSAVPDGQLFLSKITMQVKSDSLLTTRVYENANGESYPFDEKISLNGNDCKMVVYDMPRTSTAKLSDTDGSVSVSSTTTFNGNYGAEDMVAKETWKIDPATKMLTLTFSNKMSGTETTGTFYYEKAK